MPDGLRQRLRQAAWTPEAPPVEELYASAVTRSRRRHRAQATTAGAVVLLLVATLALLQAQRQRGVDVHTGGSPPSAGASAIVPWAPIPLRPEPALYATPTPASTAGVPQCTGTDLTATVVGEGWRSRQ